MRFGTLAIVMLGVVGCGPEDPAEMVTSKVVLTENLFGAEPVALPGVDVFIDDAEGNRTVLTTDAAGEAEWEMDAELGPVDVTIWGANNDAIVSLLEMPLGGDPIRWRYRRAAPQQITLSGEVIDGKWGSGALVSAFGQQRYWNLDVEPDPDSWTYSLGVEPGQPARLLFTRSEFTWNGSSHDAERRYTLIDVPASDTSHTVDVDLTSMAETTTHAGTMPLPQGFLGSSRPSMSASILRQEDHTDIGWWSKAIGTDTLDFEVPYVTGEGPVLVQGVAARHVQGPYGYEGIFGLVRAPLGDAPLELLPVPVLASWGGTFESGLRFDLDDALDIEGTRCVRAWSASGIWDVCHATSNHLWLPEPADDVDFASLEGAISFSPHIIAGPLVSTDLEEVTAHTRGASIIRDAAEFQ